MGGHWCVNVGECIGCSVCSDTDPTVFGLDETECLAYVLQVPERDLKDRPEAIESEEDCPVEAIFWHEGDHGEREPVCKHPELKRYGGF